MDAGSSACVFIALRDAYPMGWHQILVRIRFPLLICAAHEACDLARLARLFVAVHHAQCLPGEVRAAFGGEDCVDVGSGWRADSEQYAEEQCWAPWHVRPTTASVRHRDEIAIATDGVACSSESRQIC